MTLPWSQFASTTDNQTTEEVLGKKNAANEEVIETVEGKADGAKPDVFDDPAAIKDVERELQSNPRTRRRILISCGVTMKVTNLVSRGSVLATTHALYNSSKSHLGASSSGVRITKKSIGRKHL